MRDKILEDLKIAMKEQDKLKLNVIRMVKGAMQLDELNKKRSLTDDEVIDVISKQIKTRREAIVEFEKGNRYDLIEQNNKEIEVLSSYMPKALSSDELNAILDKVFMDVNPTSAKDMGLIMKTITPLVKGKCDMKELSEKIKEKLNKIII